MLKKHLFWWGLGLTLTLQGCLLELFLAPKVSPESLPGPTELKSLKQAYAQHCGACHLLVHPKYFDQDHPIRKTTQRYIKEKVLNEKEAKLIVTYIQALTITTESPAK